MQINWYLLLSSIFLQTEFQIIQTNKISDYQNKLL